MRRHGGVRRRTNSAARSKPPAPSTNHSIGGGPADESASLGSTAPAGRKRGALGAPPELIAALMAIDAATPVRAARTAVSIHRARTALCHEPTNRGLAETAITKSSPCPLGAGAAAMARVPPMKDSTTIATAATNVELRMRIALPSSPPAPGGLLYASRQLRCNSCLRLPRKPHEVPQVSALCHDDPSPGLRSAGSERPGGWADRMRSRRPTS